MAAYLAPQKIFCQLSYAEKFFLLIIALTGGFSAADLTQRFLTTPAIYRDFLVGAITWEASTKLQDLASFPAFLLGFLIAAAIVLRLFEQVIETKTDSYRSSLTTTIIWWFAPCAIGVGGLFSPYPNSNSFAIVMSFTGLILTFFIIRFQPKHSSAMPNQLALGVLASMLVGLAPVAAATIIDRLPLLASIPRTLIKAKLAIFFFAGAYIYFLLLCKKGDAAINRSLPRILLIAQLCMCPLYLLILPDLYLDSANNIPAIKTTPWIWWLCVILIGASMLDIGLRYKKHLERSSVDLISLLSPLAIFSSIILFRNSQTVIPSIPTDDYHFGESLLGWWSFLKFGKIPYIDYMPPHGIFGDDIGGYLSQIFYDGTAATLAEADRLAATLTLLLSFLALYFYTESLGLAYISILLFGFISRKLFFLFLTPFFCIWLKTQKNYNPRLWLWTWFITATILVLAVPPQGIIAVAASIPVLAVHVFRAKPSNWKLDISLLIVLVSALLFTPAPKMLYGAIRYVLENGKINQIAYGVPWSWSWSSTQDKSKVLLAIGLEIFRMSWVWIPLLAAVIIIAMRAQKERRTYVLCVALPIFLFASLMTSYSMGRIDPGGMSRPGLLSGFAWAILLPLLLTPIITQRGRALLAVSIAFLCSGQGLIGIEKEGLVNIFKENKIGNLWSGADHGLANLGFGAVDPSHAARLMRINRFLSDHLAPHETYLDLTGHNADYIYFDRPPPIDTTAPYNLAPIEQQTRAIFQLNKSLPKIALLEADNINHDGGGMALRTHSLYRFIVNHYTAEIHDGYVYGFDNKNPIDKPPISFEPRDITDGNWEHGVNRTEAAIVIRDSVTIQFLKAGESLRLPNNQLRKIIRVWPEGNAIWLDGPRVETNDLFEKTLYVERSEEERKKLSIQLMNYVYAVSDLRKIPVAWGRSSASLKSVMKPVVNLNTPPNLHDLTMQDKNLQIAGNDPYLWLDLSKLTISGNSAGLLKFDFICNGISNPRLQVFWWGDDMSGSSAINSLNFTAANGTLIVPLDAYPSWLALQKANGIRVDVDSANACQSISVKNISLQQRLNAPKLGGEF